MLTFIWPTTQVTVAGVALEVTQQAVLAEIVDFHADNTSENSGLQTSLTSIDGKTPSLVTGRVPVDGSGVTQPVSAVSLPLPSGASTSALQTTGNSSLSSIDTKLSSQATAANQATGNASLSSIDTQLNSQATAANQSTGNSSLSSIDTKLTSQATAANQSTGNSSLSSIDTKLTSQATASNQTASQTLLGAVTETAPATDTASSGLNGRLQRIAQRLTSLIALLPTSLGQKTMANGLAVTIASDQSAVPASQSGTWTVQPGNTANTTAWLTQQDKSATSTLANVAGSASSVTLQASNSSRKGWSCHNDSSAILYVKFGSSATSTSYTVKLIADAYYELPTTSVYTGIITGIWASATGSARVTELT
jgi:hypothetical protein